MPETHRTSEHTTTFEVYDILKFYFENESDDFKILDDENNTLYTSEEVLLTMIDKYSDWFFTVSDIFASSAANYFLTRWQTYLSRMGDNFRRTYAAFYAEYDPISNYDMIETGADGRRLDATTRETTPTGTTTTANTIKRAGFNSAESVLSDESESTTSFDEAKTTETETPDNTKTMSFNGSTLTGYHDATEHNLTRKGNIGVTTSQQMIQSELDLRRVDLLADFIAAFAAQALWYAG